MYWYHEQTRHSYDSVRAHRASIDWNTQPEVYKHYPNTYPHIRLDKDHPEHRFVYYIAGLTAQKRYPGFSYVVRANPSAGALYPNELYFQVRDIPNMEDGIYHFDAGAESLTQLCTINPSEGLESFLGYKSAMAGYLFLVSAVYYRSSWKYHTRAFRYCLLDAGHLLGGIEAAALLKPHAVQMRHIIDREGLNRYFGFDRDEWFVAGATVARPKGTHAIRPPDLRLPSIAGTSTFEANLEIEKAYKQTCQIEGCRGSARAPHFDYEPKKLTQAILTRRSQRGFGGEAITKGQFGYLMEVLAQPILNDCDEPIMIYAVLNRVIDMPLGLYCNGSFVREGDLAREAGYLCLEQYGLAQRSAVTFFLTSKGDHYQALYTKAGIIGHRLYLAAHYLGIGCSGIGAYYDDEVNRFVENEQMVLYALAIGK
jgi:SagB-type dehydrogenase family enzyme